MDNFVENTFFDVKVGDLVLVKREISVGWRQGYAYWCLSPITAVTKAQFTVANKKYWKKNGNQVGDEFKEVRKVGSLRPWSYGSKETLSDETEAYNAMAARVANLRRMYDRLEEVKRIHFSEMLASSADQSLIVELTDTLDAVIQSYQKYTSQG